MKQSVEAVVCIPSFRRPEGLLRTLQSLADTRNNIAFAVVVIDNDDVNQQALEVARAFFADHAVIGHAVIEPRQGNAHAINSAFTTAMECFSTARYFLMIDDDEIARPGWVDAMVATARNFDAAIVGGPVRRTFSRSVPEIVSHHPLFQSIETATGPIEIIHGSGNCLISRDVFTRLGKPLFDTRFNLLGGGDMDFFTRARLAGFRFAWSGDAVVDEIVGTERISVAWLLRRSLRTGAINYSIDRKRRSGIAGWLALTGKNMASLGRGLARFTKGLLVSQGNIVSASHWLVMPLGRLLASVGWMPTPYRPKNCAKTASSRRAG